MTSKRVSFMSPHEKEPHNKVLFYLPTSCKGSGEEFPLTEMAADLSIKRPLERMCQNFSQEKHNIYLMSGFENDH